MDFKKLFNFDYLFNPYPSADFFFAKPLLVFFSIILVLALATYFTLKKPPYQKLKKGLFRLFLSCSLTGFVLLFFRNQAIPYFSMRVWLILFFIIYDIWALFILFYLARKLPFEIRQYQKQLEKEKYLPKKS
ncbi:hypothetical protein HYU72_00515 [Candidatus Berkelbacteria bacterium]|nr:hypothetical protein [Candidatus Berkelbacteria bacterium]MBI2588527.1 hypothetical protein [Candidatus Berkelbacteria bacterium]